RTRRGGTLRRSAAPPSRRRIVRPSCRINAERCPGHVWRWGNHRSPVAAVLLLPLSADRSVEGSAQLQRRPTMAAIIALPDSQRYARSVEASKRVHWEVEADVIRGRRFDAAHKFLPDGLVLAETFTTLSPAEKRFVSQIQGRTYANVFGL